MRKRPTFVFDIARRQKDIINGKRERQMCRRPTGLSAINWRRLVIIWWRMGARLMRSDYLGVEDCWSWKGVGCKDHKTWLETTSTRFFDQHGGIGFVICPSLEPERVGACVLQDSIKTWVDKWMEPNVFWSLKKRWFCPTARYIQMGDWNRLHKKRVTLISNSRKLRAQY